MDIKFLADVPEAVPLVAKWLFDEWGHHKEGNTLDRVRERLEPTINKSTLPIILVAANNKTPIGTASLRHSDGIENRPDLTPWLASVYVTPAHRGKGVATKLITEIASIAKQLGTETLYLRTEDKEALYKHLGWTTLETFKTENDTTTIMYLDVS